MQSRLFLFRLRIVDANSVACVTIVCVGGGFCGLVSRLFGLSEVLFRKRVCEYLMTRLGVRGRAARRRRGAVLIGRPRTPATTLKIKRCMCAP